jgi:hypothetical protein
MAKIIDYPRASLRSALQLAETVDSFAGSCSVELAAEKLGKKLSGAFSALVGSAVRYGLLESKAAKLTIRPLYKNYKLAYTPEEETKYLREAMLSPILFKAIYARFKGQRLPVSHFEKMLIKEFSVPTEIASRVAGYFIDGAKQASLLSEDSFLIDVSTQPDRNELEESEEVSHVTNVGTNSSKPEADAQLSSSINPVNHNRSVASKTTPGDDFWLNIRGPGVDFSLEISETEDLKIVEIMLRKIEKVLKQRDSLKDL